MVRNTLFYITKFANKHERFTDFCLYDIFIIRYYFMKHQCESKFNFYTYWQCYRSISAKTKC